MLRLTRLLSETTDAQRRYLQKLLVGKALHNREVMQRLAQAGITYTSGRGPDASELGRLTDRQASDLIDLIGFIKRRGFLSRAVTPLQLQDIDRLEIGIADLGGTASDYRELRKRLKISGSTRELSFDAAAEYIQGLKSIYDKLSGPRSLRR